MAIPSSRTEILRTGLARLKLRASPWLGRGLGALLGLAASWYGLAAGLLIGSMVDLLRAEGRLRAWLANPGGIAIGDEPRGLAAAAALAFLAAWPRPGSRDLRKKVLEEAWGHKKPRPRLPPGLLRLLSGQEGLEAARLASLSRILALEGSPEARRLLADFAYSLAAAAQPSSPGLDHPAEEAIRTILLDAGLEAAELRAARRRSFPAYRDPWEVLGIEPGTGRTELKKAWRRSSKSLHPDHGPQGDGAGGLQSFLEAQAAYEYLWGRLEGKSQKGKT
jgi:hypothetical protein